ncbi:hypothetical protein GF371_00675 [Candidatus Woesearchaeota archaeon]|nr:hypothetical protein [Candidatus Woesearchaeota archaeon]
MELMFIPAKAEFDLKELNLSKLKKLPKKLGLVSTVQFVDDLKKIKKYLDSHGFSCVIGGEILGCRVENAEKIKAKVDAFLFIGGGMFHPLALRKLGKPIYLVNGKEVKENKNIKKNWVKFLHADKVGILISTKPGQSHIKIAEKMKNDLKKKYPDKEFFLFLCDNVMKEQINNFPFIKAWINTACPRIADDIDVLNYEDLVFFSEEQ